MDAFIGLKVKFLIGLFLLVAFGVAPVFAQEQSENKEKLVMEFVKLDNLRFPLELTQTPPYKPSVDWVSSTKEEKETFRKLFHTLLSKRGSIEVDSRNTTFIITDVKSRAEFTKELAIILDKSGISFSEFVSRSAKPDEKLVTERLKPKIYSRSSFVTVLPSQAKFRSLLGRTCREICWRVFYRSCFRRTEASNMAKKRLF
jgi:hypothetical protein